LVTGVKSYLKIKLQEIRKHYPDWEYIEIGIKKDYVHLYMVIPPKYAVSKVVETIKKNTGRSLSIKFAFLKKVYWDDQGIWAKGYFVSTVGINDFNPIQFHFNAISPLYVLQGKNAICNDDAITYEKTREVIEDKYDRKVRINRYIADV